MTTKERIPALLSQSEFQALVQMCWDDEEGVENQAARNSLQEMTDLALFVEDWSKNRSEMCAFHDISLSIEYWGQGVFACESSPFVMKGFGRKTFQLFMHNTAGLSPFGTYTKREICTILVGQRRLQTTKGR